MANGVNKLYEINGIKVIQGLCTVDFHIKSDLGSKELTHGDLYKIIESATSVTAKTEQGFAKIMLGGVEVTAYKKSDSTMA